MCFLANVVVAPVLLDAVIFGYTVGPNSIQPNGSVGDDVRGVVKRGGVIIETTADVPNTGNPSIPFTTILQNGDMLCVQVSNDNFTTNDEDCGVIPTPFAGFNWNV